MGGSTSGVAIFIPKDSSEPSATADDHVSERSMLGFDEGKVYDRTRMGVGATGVLFAESMCQVMASRCRHIAASSALRCAGPPRVAIPWGCNECVGGTVRDSVWGRVGVRR